MKKIIAVATSAAMVFSFIGQPSYAMASGLQKEIVENEIADSTPIVATTAKVSKLKVYGTAYETAYDEAYRMPNSNVSKITANGGIYPGTKLEYMLDNDPNTHWETKTNNSDSFTNELVFELGQAEVLNRVAFLARSINQKGFPEEFEIYASETSKGETFQLVSSGTAVKTSDFVEFKFQPTKFKRIKFVFKKADINRPFAAEFRFYKVDDVSDQMERLFTDEKQNQVSDEFNTPAKIEVLEEIVKKHPLYDLYKEDLENAKILVNSEKIVPTTAKVSKLKAYGTAYETAYDEAYRMPNSNVSNITANGGIYPGTKLEYMLDNDPNTHWETKTNNSDSFTNELVFELGQAEVLNRVAFLARSINQKGFPEEFEIYASETSKGETFQLVSSGTAVKTSDFVEFKFQPTKFKRIKFVFKKADINRPFAAEFRFYKADDIADKMESLFTDEKQNQVSEEFNTPDKLKALEEIFENHPLYELYKEDLENAKVLVSAEKIEATTAVTKSVDYYSNEKYSELFRMSNDNIKSFSNNGGKYLSQVLANAFDGKLDTYWETNKANTADFSNEVEVEFNNAVTLNRIVYGARPDLKGFAQEFEIYGSKTSKGDTYELVATGAYSKTSGLVEAKFEPTTFKRVKFVFKKSDQNWATLSELAFYKEDEIDNIMDGLFTDATRSAVVSEYNSIAKLEELEQKAMSHPLYSTYKEQLDFAKKLVKGEVDLEGTVITAEQRGDMRKHAQQNLRMGLGTNNLPTGLVAKPGDTITVYVNADNVNKLPSLVFTQQEGSWSSWSRSVSLKPGKNVITVPTISQSSYNHEVVKGGTIYISNPYTAEEQGEAPVLRFEGVEKVPMMTLDTDPEKFKEELIAYKKKMDEDVAAHPNVADREVVDVVEMISNHVIFTGTATEAYNQFIIKGNNPMDTVTGYDEWMKQIFKTYGLDGSSELHDPKLIRENIRLMQPHGAMYAAGDHTGIQSGTIALMLSDFRKTAPGWGLNHEIGHRLAMGEREYGEITNNMVSMLMSVEAHNLYGSAIDNRIPYESTIYKYVIEENKVTMASQGYFARLGAYWQLELAHPGYWADLTKLYRERKLTASTDLQKQQYYVELSSELLGYDLSSYFARHGFTVTDETKEKTAKYPEPKKLWYLNDSVLYYEGTGFADKNASIKYSIKVDSAAKKNTLNFRIDDAYTEDVLGYEIYRDGELIGFTSTNQFVDSTDVTVNHTYQIVAYDKKLNTANPVEFKAFVPQMSVEDQVTLKLNQDFDAKDYVKAVDYQGNDITGEVTVKSNNVDVTKKGNYEVVYAVENEGSTVTKTTNVTVTSDFVYASDLTPESAKVGWGQFRKDTDIGGSTIDLFRQGLQVTYEKGLGAHANSEVVYNIEGKGYDFFESYIGIDYDATRTKASATFEVYVDGEKKFSSDVMKVSTEHGYVKVPVTGAKQVKLVTTDAGDNTSDHTLWADAKFTIKSSAPSLTIPTSDTGIEMVKLNADFDLNAGVTATDAEDGNLLDKVDVETNGFTTKKPGTYTIKYTITDNDGNTVSKERKIFVYSATNYASDMQWESATAGWKTVQKDKNIEGKTMQLLVNGAVKDFAKGIGTHADSEIVYDLSGTNAEYFETYVGVDRNFTWATGTASVIFKIIADGKEVFNSGLMKYGTEAKHVVIPVKGVKELKLVVNDSGNGTDSDRADFADAKFYTVDIYTGDLEQAIEEAKSISLDEYTEESVNELTAKLAAAEELLTKENVTQSEVNTALEELKSAVEGLTKIDLTQVVTVKDSTLREAIKRTLGVTGDLTLGDMYKLTELTYHGARQVIQSLEGLEYAKNLVTLDITGNEVTDFSPLKDLKKLTNLKASPQYKVVGMLTGSSINVENLVTDIDGNKVLPNVVSLRNNTTSEETVIDTAEWSENLDTFNIDMTNQESGMYTLTLGYEVNENLIQLVYMVKYSVDLTQVVDVKDSTLKGAIKETLGVTGDLTIGDMYKLTELTYHGARETIKSLEGLEYAKNLVTLDITGNEVTDFSPLKDLKKLTDLKANPQYKVMDMLKGSNISLENLVTNIDGNKVLPNKASLRNNSTLETTVIDTKEWSEDLNTFNIDMTEKEKAMYTLTLAYEVNGNVIQLVYMINNK